MDYKTIIINSIQYIEDNIHRELTPSQVAMKAGYSEYHFYRMFSSITGMPLTQFIIKRRLKYAIYAISTGQKMLDAAIEYGFNTHAGFFKAFKKEYGCAPSTYLKNNTVKAPSIYVLEKEANIMISEAKVKLALTHWELTTPYTIDGVFNDDTIKRKDQWIINKKYILKATKNKTKVKLNHFMTEALMKKNIVTPPFVMTKDEKVFVELEGCYLFLKPLMTTSTLTANQLIRDEQGYITMQLGEMTGHLQKILKDCEEEASFDDVSLFDVVNGWAMPVVKKMMVNWERTLPEIFFKDYLTTFGELSMALPRQIIHRNLHLSNMLYRDGEFAGYGDFELVERNVRLFDPCYLATSVLAGLFQKPEQMDKWPTIYKNIIKGYDQVALLTEIEKSSLIYVLYSIQMIFIAYFGEQNDYQSLAEDNYNGLCWIYEHRDALLCDF